MSMQHRPIDPLECIHNLRALARQAQRNARLLDRLYTAEGHARAAELRTAAEQYEGWARDLEGERKQEEAA